MRLVDYKEASVEIQRRDRKKIIAAFKEYWDSNPSIEDFGETMDGIIIFPEIVYYAIKNR